MKKIICIALLCAGTCVTKAQQKPTNINPIKGYWVVESNVKSPKKQVVKFYNDSLQLVYEESYDQKVLKSAKKRTRSMLDSALVAVLRNSNELGSSTILARAINTKPKVAKTNAMLK